MTREFGLLISPELALERALWRSVIARTIQDWLAAPLRGKIEAERYLFNNSADLSLVCDSAGINVWNLRRCLTKVRGRTMSEIMPATD
jgi:hypothetical protein